MNIQDILKLSPEQQIAAVESGDISDAIVYTLPLDTALTNFAVEISGNFFCCIFGTDVNSNADIQFNKITPNSADSINYSQGLQTARPFARFFVTCTAQAGKVIKFLIATTYPLFSVTDNRSATLQGTYLADIADQLKGQTAAGTYAADVSVTTSAASIAASNASRRAICFYADEANTGDIYLGFDNGVTTAKKVIELKARDFFTLDDYRGVWYAIASTGTQKLSVSEW